MSSNDTKSDGKPGGNSLPMAPAHHLRAPSAGDLRPTPMQGAPARAAAPNSPESADQTDSPTPASPPESPSESAPQTDEKVASADPLDPRELEEAVIEQLKTCYDPEIPIDIYELGLIYKVKATPEGDVAIEMTLTSPACPVAGTMPGEVEQKVRNTPGVRNVSLDLVFDPPWDQEMMSEAAKLTLGFM